MFLLIWLVVSLTVGGVWAVLGRSTAPPPADTRQADEELREYLQARLCMLEDLQARTADLWRRATGRQALSLQRQVISLDKQIFEIRRKLDRI